MSDGAMRRLRDRDSTLAGRAPRAEGPVPGRPEAPSSRGAQSETMESLRAERDRLAQRLADLIAILPAAIAVRVRRIQQLEERTAQLQRNYDRLAKEGEELRQWRWKWEAAVKENVALRALLEKVKFDSKPGANGNAGLGIHGGSQESTVCLCPGPPLGYRGTDGDRHLHWSTDVGGGHGDDRSRHVPPFECPKQFAGARGGHTRLWQNRPTEGAEGGRAGSSSA